MTLLSPMRFATVTGETYGGRGRCDPGRRGVAGARTARCGAVFVRAADGGPGAVLARVGARRHGLRELKARVGKLTERPDR